MKDFTFYSPTKILFGSSQFETFLSELKKISSNILIVTGGGSVEKLGYLQKLENALNENSINFENYKGIEPNPLSQTCLLYTSPSPRDKRQSRMPSSA